MTALHREVEVFRRSGAVEAHLQGIAALEDPDIVVVARRIKQAREQTIERHLPAQPMQVNRVPARPVGKPRLTRGSKGQGRGVPPWSGRREPA